MRDIKTVLKAYLPMSIRPFLGRLRARQKSLTGTDIQRYIDAALVERAHGAARAGESDLAGIFNRDLAKRSGLPGTYIEELLRTVEATRSLVSIEWNHAHSLTDETRRLDATVLSRSAWLLLCHLCIRNGLFEVGEIVRRKAIESAYQEGFDDGGGIDSLVDTFKAGIDQADFATAQAMLAQLRTRGVAGHHLRQLEHYYFLNQGDLRATQKIAAKKIRKADAGFSRYIDEKSLALVGPAPVEAGLASEIDSFGAVVRFNYRGKRFLPPAAEFGTRLDISYFDGQTARWINQTDDRSFLEDLAYAVFKSTSYPFQKQLVHGGHARTLLSNRFLFAGSATGLQRALYDVLHFNPSRIKLFHLNFFLSDTSAYAAYRPEQDNAPSARWEAFALQEIVGNLNFIRNLWKGGLVEVDKDCESVLRMTSDEYMMAMQRIYVAEPMKAAARQ